MLTAMSSWLESVMTALAPSFLTRSSAVARARSGELPELPSTMSNRTLPWPACSRAWFIVCAARRMESLQLGVAMDPVRSRYWPMRTTVDFGSLLQAAAASRAEKIRLRERIGPPAKFLGLTLGGWKRNRPPSTDARGALASRGCPQARRSGPPQGRALRCASLGGTLAIP